MPPAPSPPVAARNVAGSLGPALFASIIAPGVTSQSWSIGSQRGQLRCHAFLALRGLCSFKRRTGDVRQLSAPALLWLPGAEPGEFRMEAGGEGAMFAAADDYVARRIAELAAAATLKPLAERAVLAEGEEVAARLDELRASFSAIARETRSSGPAAAAIAELHLGLVLLHVWRLLDRVPGEAAAQIGLSTAPRFRQLIELHYRENLSVAAYARKLGVSRAHLHDVCVRATGRAPLQLVHDRLIEEAEQRLERTTLTIEQIGYSLGFRDSGYFNRFFKRRKGVSPGAYRKAANVPPAKAAVSFAAWP